MTINLSEIEVDVKYNYEPTSIGGSHPDGGAELLPPALTVYSVKWNDVEIIKALSPKQIVELEEQLLEEKLSF